MARPLKSESDKILDMEIANRIIQVRTSTLINGKYETQDDLASFLGTNRGTISKYESYVVTVPKQTLISIANHYGVSVGWLLTGQGSMAIDADMDIAVKTTELTDRAINNIKNGFYDYSHWEMTSPEARIKAFNEFLESDDLYKVIDAISIMRNTVINDGNCPMNDLNIVMSAIRNIQLSELGAIKEIQDLISKTFTNEALSKLKASSEQIAINMEAENNGIY